MATLEFITKADLEQFKKELFAELRRPTFKLPTPKNQQKPWLKSYEVRKLLDISPVAYLTICKSHNNHPERSSLF